MQTETALSPPTKRQVAKAATRALILKTAKVCFETLGYERADMRTIAACADRTTGAIFGHFSGKAELYREIYGHDLITPGVAAALLSSLKKLTMMARTSGGTPGPDAGLMDACAEAEALIAEAA